MKTTTFGDYFFMVVVYYTDKDGNMHSHTERWSRKEYAKEMKDMYVKHANKWFDGIEFKGTINDVFTYKCKLCTIA